MQEHSVRVGAVLRRSRVNGPGVRTVIWVQGCSRRCPGCCNPEFQATEGGVEMSIAALLGELDAAGAIDGISLSGGEPFLQAEALAELCQRVRERDLTVVCFTGYTLEEIRSGGSRAWLQLLSGIDLLIAGSYMEDSPCEEPLRASANQSVHFLTGRFEPGDLAAIPRAEIILDGGEIRVSGFDPALSERLRDTLAGKEGPNA